MFFNRVWHGSLLYKLKFYYFKLLLFLPVSYYLIIRSYLCDRSFAVRQGSDLSPDLFNIYTSDIPKTANTIIATYVDDTAILASNSDPVQASTHLQNHLYLINTWATKCRILINPSNYHLHFRKITSPHLKFMVLRFP